MKSIYRKFKCPLRAGSVYVYKSSDTKEYKVTKILKEGTDYVQCSFKENIEYVYTVPIEEIIIIKY